VGVTSTDSGSCCACRLTQVAGADVTGFTSYKQDLIVGASLQVSAPTGQYDDTKLVNIGTHRWSFKPEVGVSKALGPWTLEFTAAVTLFTDNSDFFNGNTRSQAPLYSFRARSTTRPGIWAPGRRTSRAAHDLSGTRNNDLSRTGAWATLALPMTSTTHQALREQRGVRSHRQ
jgi:hypothetical protein